jgi:hypothetical protein
MGHISDDDMVGQNGLAGGKDVDGGDSFGNAFLAVGGVQALDEDGVGFSEDQVQGGLDLENKFFQGDDVEGAEFQGSRVVLVVEDTQAGDVGEYLFICRGIVWRPSGSWRGRLGWYHHVVWFVICRKGRGESCQSLEERVSVREWQWEGVKLQEPESKSTGAIGTRMKSLTEKGFIVVRDLDLEEVWGLLDEQSHSVSYCSVDGVKNFFYGFWGQEVHGKAVQVNFEGIPNIVAIIIQLVPGDAKFGEGENWVSEGGVFVEVLEKLGEFSCVVQFLAGVQGDADKLGQLNFHFLKAVIELVKFLGVVQTQSCAENALDYSSNETFVLYPDFEVDRSLMVSGLCRGTSQIWQIS